MNRDIFRSILALSTLTMMSSVASATDYRNDVGYTKLQAQLGSSLPTGAGVAVTQVEFPSGGSAYFPDLTNAEFTGKTLTAKNTPVNQSGHATTVGTLFYGNSSSMAPAIKTANVYDTDDWLGSSYLQDGAQYLPQVTTDRVANHSWIGGDSSPETLERLDYVIQQDNFINVVAANNPNNGGPTALLSGSFNAISVGLTNGLAASGTTAVGSIYVAGRASPDVVAPGSETSYATPIVASTAAMLVSYAHADPSLSHGTVYSTRTGLTLQYAETNDVIKAAIMAGADRTTANVSTTSNVTDYGDALYATKNGLDTRYGAGQVDVYNSYHIIAAGQQSPTTGTGLIKQYGFDYQPASINTAVENYRFTGESLINATLAWNAHIDTGLNATLAHFNLSLLLVNGNGTTTPVATSNSSIDSSQNISYSGLSLANTYELQVSRADSLGSWDYGLAWNLTAVPEPVGSCAMVMASSTLLGKRRRVPRRLCDHI